MPRALRGVRCQVIDVLERAVVLEETLDELVVLQVALHELDLHTYARLEMRAGVADGMSNGRGWMRQYSLEPSPTGAFRRCVACVACLTHLDTHAYTLVGMFSSKPPLMSSTATTFIPSSCAQYLATCEPTNPAAPVTSTRVSGGGGTYSGLLYRVHARARGACHERRSPRVVSE